MHERKSPLSLPDHRADRLRQDKYVVDMLRGGFRRVFNFIILICPTFAVNKTWHNFARGDPRFLVMMPDSCEDDDVNECLRTVADLFHNNSKDEVLVILDDCAVSSDVEKRTSKLVDLAFSGRHIRLSVWLLTQQLTSIAKPFRENVKCDIAFFNPEKDSSDLFFRKFASFISPEEKKQILQILKDHEHSKLCIRMVSPFSFHVEIPRKKNVFSFLENK